MTFDRGVFLTVSTRICPLSHSGGRGILWPMFGKEQDRRQRWKQRSGQAMVEYIIVFVVLLGVVSVASICLYAVRQQSNRALDLVASEYP